MRLYRQQRSPHRLPEHIHRTVEAQARANADSARYPSRPGHAGGLHTTRVLGPRCKAAVRNGIQQRGGINEPIILGCGLRRWSRSGRDAHPWTAVSTPRSHEDRRLTVVSVDNGVVSVTEDPADLFANNGVIRWGFGNNPAGYVFPAGRHQVRSPVRQRRPRPAWAAEASPTPTRSSRTASRSSAARVFQCVKTGPTRRRRLLQVRHQGRTAGRRLADQARPLGQAQVA